MSVFSPTPTYTSMLATRSLIATLLGGTEAMRAAGAAYLPQEAAEADEDYQGRLSRSVLFNQLDRTINACVGKICSKPISYIDAPEPVLEWIENIDLENTHLDRFVRTWLHDGIANGVSYVLIDAPKSLKDPSERTLADDIQEGIRPYAAHIPASAVIGWRFEPTVGRPTLTQVRILQQAKVPDGEFGEKIVDRVLVLEIGSWRLFEKGFEGTGRKATVTETLVDAGTTGLSYIPLVPYYTNKTGNFEAISPLASLAYLNVRHWQSYSDQCNILKVARIPILATTGKVSSDDSDDDLVLSSGASVQLGVGEDIKYVEHNGNAITAGRQDLLDIQDQMEKVGFSLTARETSGDVTATENSLSAAESHAALQMFALNLQDAIETVLKIMCEMGGIDAEPSVIVNKEFGGSINANDMPLILQMRDKGDLQRSTVLAEAKRRGLLSEDLVIADEVKALEAVVEPEPVIEPELQE